MNKDIIELVKQLGKELKEKDMTIATAESCTGGWDSSSDYRNSRKFSLV